MTPGDTAGAGGPAGADWTRVAWSSARQILSLAGDDADDDEAGDAASALDPGLSPARYFDALAARDPGRAVLFIAHALPRFETMIWALRVLIDHDRIDRNSALVRAMLRWSDQPVDDLRRQVLQEAEAASDTSPARLLGFAIFMSGGSISAPDLPPVLPAEGVAHQLAYAAVLKAANAAPDPAALLGAALTLGRSIAERGLTT